jgi:hypothetical protein
MAKPTVNRPERLLERLAPTGYGEAGPGEWSEEMRAGERELADRMVRIGELMVAGKPPSDPEVLDEVDWYYRSAIRYGVGNPATIRAIGESLASDEQRRAAFDEVVDGLAAYQRDAIAAYAEIRLSEGGA